MAPICVWYPLSAGPPLVSVHAEGGRGGDFSPPARRADYAVRHIRAMGLRVYHYTYTLLYKAAALTMTDCCVAMEIF